MISGPAGLGLWDILVKRYRCAKLEGYFCNEGLFLERSNCDSFPRLVTDLRRFRGAKETLLDNSTNKEAPNVALRDSAVALQ